MTHDFDPADIAVAAPDRVPDDRRPDRVRPVLPADEPRRSAARTASCRRSIVTSHGGPTASAFGGLDASRPAVHEPRLRRPRRRLRRQHRLRPGLPQAARGPVGRRRRRRLRQRRALARRAGPRRRRAARDPRRQRQRLHDALCAITFSDAFKAGTSYFGIGDLVTFRTETHKFESRYDQSADRPVARSARQLYRDRSPLNFARPDLVPGADPPGRRRPVVPPAQAEQIVDALWEKRLPARLPAVPGRGPRLPRGREHHPLVRGRAVVLRPGLRLHARPTRSSRSRSPSWTGPDTGDDPEERSDRVIPPSARSSRRRRPGRGDRRWRSRPSSSCCSRRPRWRCSPAGSASRTRSCSSSAGSPSASSPACRRSSSSRSSCSCCSCRRSCSGRATSPRSATSGATSGRSRCSRSGSSSSRRSSVAVVAQALVPDARLGGRVRARGDRRPARRRGRDVDLPAARRPSPRRHDPRGREPRQRRDRARRLPGRAHRRRDRRRSRWRAPASRSSPSAVGGIAFGLLDGDRRSRGSCKRVDDPVFSVVLTFLAPVATYLPAESVRALGRAGDRRRGHLGRAACAARDELVGAGRRRRPRGRSCCSSSTARSSS